MKQRFKGLNVVVKRSFLAGFLLWVISGGVTAFNPGKPDNPFLRQEDKDSTIAAVPAKPRLQLLRPAGPPQVLPDGAWVDSIFNTLTLEQKIGQFFMLGTYSNRNETEYKTVESLLQRYHLGGLLFFQGGPVRQATLTNRYQALSKVPLLIGIDGEWGLGMRLDSTLSFPRQMTLGALHDTELIYQMGYEIGKQCKRLGIHVNFAPVADVNSNPKNPVIGTRSFGENPENVARKAQAYMKGLQHQGVLAVAKHFPGHGDTESDSHFTLPVVNRSKAQLLEAELYPFRQLIKDSLLAVLSGHLYVPGLDSTHNLPSSLSPRIIDGLLRKEMGFRGIVFTDAMNMKGVLKAGKPADVNLQALLAGNDILVTPEAIGETIAKIKEALQKGMISQDFIDQKAKRILRAKYFAGLNEYVPVTMENLQKELTTGHAVELNKQLGEAAVTVVKNDGSLLPIDDSPRKLASLSVGDGNGTTFQQMLSRYAEVRHFNFYTTNQSERDLNEMVANMAGYDAVIVAVHRIRSGHKNNYNIPAAALTVINRLKQQGTKMILCTFGTPYSLAVFPETEAVICAYQDDAHVQGTAAQLVFGAVTSTASLPVAAGIYKEGSHISTPVLGRVSYGVPESVGMNGTILSRIDQVVKEAITQKAFPGCQVIIAHKGKVVFDKNYGHLRYGTEEPVTDETLYDLASITKVAATTQAVMLLYDQRAIDLDEKASFYLPELLGTNKQTFTVRDLLTHRSGLQPFYPKLWKSTLTGQGDLSPVYYRTTADSSYTLPVASGVFAKPSLQDSVWKWIIESPLHRKGMSEGKPVYVYSDLGFLVLQKIVERISGAPLDAFITYNLYEPLGLSHLTFNPLKRFPASRIAPTEDDTNFRKELLQGTVHDQMAAINGGTSGHAGLFGNAHDLVTLFQMNLWGGLYNGTQFIRPETIALFTRLHLDKAHRGLGWDKPNISSNSSYVSEVASQATYGHTGFTGNVVWVDPAKDLIYIFISNRVHPQANNNRINTLRTRRRIHDIAYEALLRPVES